EINEYARANLNYKPKNRPFSVIDELKMVPDVDDELFEYLSAYTRAVYIASPDKPAKINLNTVSQNVFQALLKDVSNPEQVAQAFIEDRNENLREYKEDNFQQILQDELGLSPQNLRTTLMTGV